MLRVMRRSESLPEALSWSVMLSRFQNVAHATEGMDKPRGVIFIDLAAHAMHKDIDHIGLGIEAVVPHVLKNHRFCDGPSGMAHQEFEEREFAWLQVDAGP